MNDNKIDNFGVVSTEFATSFENAFLYLSNPNNLPEWTVLFKEASEQHAILDMPDGPQTFGLMTHTSYEQGVIDWFLISEQGKQVDKSYSRLHRLNNGHCAYTFMFMLNPMPGETEQAALNRQTQLIETELSQLKKHFES